MNKITELKPNILALIYTIITILPIIIIIIKIYFYKRFFEIAKNIKELNENQEAIIKLLIEIKNKKDYDHEDI